MNRVEKSRHDTLEQWALELEKALPQSTAQLAAKLIEQRWGAQLAPMTSQLAYLQYDYRGYPPVNGVHQGKLVRSQSLVQAALRNEQTVGAGRFGENVFGWVTPPATGPDISIVDIDETQWPGGGFEGYEGVYRQTSPQRYGPETQLPLSPADFKQWVWTLELKEKYNDYLSQSWPSDELICSRTAHPLKTAAKSAFVMAAYLQRQEGSLSAQGLSLALAVAGLSPQQSWAGLTVEQLKAPPDIPPTIEYKRLCLYRYTSTDIACFSQTGQARRLLYVPGNSSPFQEFPDTKALRQWIVRVGQSPEKSQALAAHFAKDDREDGTFHAGVLTALQGMAIFPRQHHLTKTAGFFNNDGYWNPSDYVRLQKPTQVREPFAQWVLAMKQVASDSAETIRDDGQVNREQLSAVVEPLVQWINRFAPLALFVPGGEGLLALAGLIDAGYGLNQAVEAKTPGERSEGINRIVFGVLNAVPLVGAGAVIRTEERVVADASQAKPEVAISEQPELVPAVRRPLADRVTLMRGIGPSVQSFSDDVLLQIGHVCEVDADTLHLMQTGSRPPSPLLADTISRFTIDQDLQRPINAMPEGSAEAQQLNNARIEQFSQRYDALQQSDNDWVRLFRHSYPELPKRAVEDMLDRAGVDILQPHTLTESKRVLGLLSAKAQQYEQHFRVCRAYEGLYLKSVNNPDSDVLMLHTLERLPGWSRKTRVEILEAAGSAKPLDSIGLPGTGARVQVVRPAVGSIAFDQALFDALSAEQRLALGLRPAQPLQDFQFKLREQALPRDELKLGLHRMDSGLSFQSIGLRGGGFPDTLESVGLTRQVMRFQVKEIYPTMTDEQADGWLLGLGERAQTELDRLRLQMGQLANDITEWIEAIHDDIEDMDVPFLTAADGHAQGLSDLEIEAHNDTLLEHHMDAEREVRYEVAEELIAIWQERSGPETRIHKDDRFMGFHLDMAFDPVHSLPPLNIKFNNVIWLSMRNFRVTQRASLNAFLECFPNLRVLNLQGMDLRLFTELGQEVGQLPPAIRQMTALEVLNLRATHLVLTEQAAGQLGELAGLRHLDLSENPLGAPPLVIHMTQLRELNVRATGLHYSPIGLHDRAYLDRLDLRDNQLSRIPVTVRMQSVVADNVLLQGNPLTDLGSLQWVVAHRKATGINVWMAAGPGGVGRPESWLTGVDPAQAAQWSERWERIAATDASERFFGTVEVLTRTADFVVDYAPLQQRVWQMVDEMDASPPLCQHLIEDVQWTPEDGNDPFVSFRRLEERMLAFREASAKKPRMDKDGAQ